MAAAQVTPLLTTDPDAFIPLLTSHLRTLAAHDQTDDSYDEISDDLDTQPAPDDAQWWYEQQTRHDQATSEPTATLDEEPSEEDTLWLAEQYASETIPPTISPEQTYTGQVEDLTEQAPVLTPREQVLAADRERATDLGLDHLYSDTISEPSLLDTPPSDVEQLGTTSVERIIDLNEHAAQFWQNHYKGSGADEYMRRRFGTDLADDPRFRVGYAPASWDALVTHFTRNRLATPDELIDAGLAKYNTRGKLMDTFRDRVVLPVIDQDGHILAFQGRARPGTESEKNPKYYNTATTAAWTKGEHLYGEHLLTGQTPVVVEGPMDAVAVTLAGDGHAVGVAPLGAAFTPIQAQKLATQPRVILGQDTDQAGQKAVERANRLLTQEGVDTRRLGILGKDPADMWHDNPTSLQIQLANPDVLPDATTDLLTRRLTALIVDDSATLDYGLQAITDEHRQQVTPWVIDQLSILPPERIRAVLAHISTLTDSVDKYWTYEIEAAVYNRTFDTTTGTTTVPAPVPGTQRPETAPPAQDLHNHDPAEYELNDADLDEYAAGLDDWELAERNEPSIGL